MEIVKGIFGVGLDVFLLLYFMKDHSFRRPKWMAAFYCFFYLTIVVSVNCLAGDKNIRIILFSILAGIYLALFYENVSVLISVKLTAIYFILMILSEMSAALFLTMIGNSGAMNKLLQANTIMVFIFVAGTKMLNLMFIVLWKRFGRFKNKKFGFLKTISTFVLVAVVMSTIVLSTENMENLNETVTKEAFARNMMIFALVIFLCTSFVIFIDYYESVNEKQRMIDLLLFKNVQQHQMFQEKMKQNEVIRKIHHDLKNHMLYIKDCFEKNKNEQGIQYINEFLKQEEKYQATYNTGDRMLDCLLNDLHKKCEEKEIHLTAEVEGMTNHGMSEFDLCSLFGNILDNAYEACEKLGETEEKNISLKVKIMESFLVIKLSNSTFMPGNEALTTTKEDKKNHGLGLKNVDDVLEKYEGIRKTEFQDGEFTMMIMIPVGAVHLSNKEAH